MAWPVQCRIFHRTSALKCDLELEGCAKTRVQSRSLAWFSATIPSPENFTHLFNSLYGSLQCCRRWCYWWSCVKPHKTLFFNGDTTRWWMHVYVMNLSPCVERASRFSLTIVQLSSPTIATNDTFSETDDTTWRSSTHKTLCCCCRLLHYISCKIRWAMCLPI